MDRVPVILFGNIHFLNVHVHDIGMGLCAGKEVGEFSPRRINRRCKKDFEKRRVLQGFSGSIHLIMLLSRRFKAQTTPFRSKRFTLSLGLNPKRNERVG
jgi:hypothetical protein